MNYEARDVPSGMALAMKNSPTRGEDTLRDLRRYAAGIINDHDRELVQHAADMLEIALRAAMRQ